MRRVAFLTAMLLTLYTSSAEARWVWTAADNAKARAGETVFLDLPSDEGGTVAALFFVLAPPGVARDVLWDHARFPEFMPAARSAKILEKRGNVHIVELGGGQGPISISYVTERHLEKDSIWWKTLRGDVKRNDGFWRFQAAGAGTLVTYQVNVVPHGPVPGGITAYLQKRALPGMITAVKKRIESHARP